MKTKVFKFGESSSPLFYFHFCIPKGLWLRFCKRVFSKSDKIDDIYFENWKHFVMVQISVLSSYFIANQNLNVKCYCSSLEVNIMILH